MTTPVQTWTKDPDARLRYSLDWSSWLADDDSISDHSATVTSGDVEVDGATLLDGAVVTAWIQSGTADTDAEVTFQITTADGAIDERTIGLQVRER